MQLCGGDHRSRRIFYVEGALDCHIQKEPPHHLIGRVLDHRCIFFKTCVTSVTR